MDFDRFFKFSQLLLRDEFVLSYSGYVSEDILLAVGDTLRERLEDHARDGAQSRHNLIYWRYGDYLGIGPGAHGRLTQNGNRFATECFSNPKRWLDAAASGATEKPRELLTTEDQGSEFLMMGLRLKEGVDLRRYEALSGAPLSTKKITQMQDIGMISRDKDQLYVTDQGFMVLNAILAELLSD